MKRTGIKRGKPLAPGGPLPRKGSRPGRGAPIKPVSRKRKREAYARNFGPEADAVRAMPCLCAPLEPWEMTVHMATMDAVHERTPCLGKVDAAHVDARGMGGCNGDGRVGLVPLCRGHHEEAGEARTSKRAAFEARYGLDLRAEADRIAVGHEPPLGIRGLAQRFARCAACGGAGGFEQSGSSFAGCRECDGVPVEPLADHETAALLGWVRREMQAEHDRRRRQDCDGPRWAVYIGDMLGIRSDDNAGDSVPGSWALCEAAGWPS